MKTLTPFLLYASVAMAQIVPPTGVVEWDRGAGTDAWETAGNWGGNAAPSSGADVLFGTAPVVQSLANPYAEPLRVEQSVSDLALKSLWFEAGRDYTIGGSGSLLLGAGLEDGGRLITVLNNNPAAWQSEHTLDLDFRLALASGRTAEIANASDGGLRLSGAVDLAQNHLRVRGGSFVHLAGVISGAGDLTIATDAGHVILSADNSATWSGNIDVRHGLLVVTENGALGATSGQVVIDGAGSGATLAFRPKGIGSGVTYTTAQPITVSGTGYLRPWGRLNNSDQSSPLNLLPIGAIYNDGGDNAFAGAITLEGDTWIGSRTGTLLLSGQISDGGAGYALTKVGRGVVALGNVANAWSGPTVVREGVLRLDVDGALPNSSNLRLSGGILGLGAGDFAASLGAGPGQLRWDDDRDGGFAAFGAARTVTLNGGSTLIWGQGGFVSNRRTLILGSAYSDAAITFTNGINLGVGVGMAVIQVERGTTAAAYAALSGKISGVGGRLLKMGEGTLWLKNSENDYSGVTAILGGVVRGYIPSASRIQISSGGRVGLDGDFTRSLSSQLVWTVNGSEGGDGGFAAYGGVHTVRLNNDSVTPLLVGPTPSFVPNGSSLVFGAPDSDGTVIFDNPLRFEKNTSHTIRVIGGTQSPAQADVVFSQVFSSTGSLKSLIFEGDGRADIVVANDGALSSSVLEARGVDLRLKQQGRFRGLKFVEASWGGTVTFDNTEDYVANRVLSTTTIRLTGGGFRYWGGTEVASTHSSRSLMIYQGASFLEILNQSAAASGYARLSFTSFGQGTLLGTIDFRTSATSPADSLNPHLSKTQIRFSTDSSGKRGNILPYATVNGSDWARVQQHGTYHYIVAQTDYDTTGGAGTSGWGSLVDASPGSNRTMTAAQSLNTLRLTSGRQFNLNGNWLTLESGVLAIGDAPTRIYGSAGSALRTPASRPLYAHIYNTAPVGLEIDAAVILGAAADSNAVAAIAGLVKSGQGTLRLSGTTSNAITGRSAVNEGVLALGKTGGAIAIGGRVYVGDRSGRDILRVERSEQIANDAQVTLRGGSPNPAHGLMGEGILQLRHVDVNGVADGLGLRETFAKLNVEGRGVIDFVGGTVAEANFLILDDLNIAPNNARLFIRNWYEGEDYLLVRRTSAHLLASLPRVEFEGYGPAVLRDWNAEFYQVTGAPEPASTGAILGAITSGLILWLRKRQQKRQ